MLPVNSIPASGVTLTPVIRPCTTLDNAQISPRASRRYRLDRSTRAKPLPFAAADSAAFRLIIVACEAGESGCIDAGGRWGREGDCGGAEEVGEEQGAGAKGLHFLCGKVQKDRRGNQRAWLARVGWFGMQNWYEAWMLLAKQMVKTEDAKNQNEIVKTGKVLQKRRCALRRREDGQASY